MLNSQFRCLYFSKLCIAKSIMNILNQFLQTLYHRDTETRRSYDTGKLTNKKLLKENKNRDKTYLTSIFIGKN